MAVLMTAFTPLQAVGLFNVADELLTARPDEEIDVLINAKRPGMLAVAEAARRSGCFRSVWSMPFGAPGHLSSVFKLNHKNKKSYGWYVLASFLKTLNLAPHLAQKLHWKAFCPTLLEKKLHGYLSSFLFEWSGPLSFVFL